MNRPLMTAEQTNIPRTEEELNAALARKAQADAREAEAHRAARAKDNSGGSDTGTDGEVSEEVKQYHDNIAEKTHALHQAMFMHAQATGMLMHHINSTLYTAAVIVANAKTPEEQARILGYITKQAAELVASRSNQQEQKSNGN